LFFKRIQKLILKKIEPRFSKSFGARSVIIFCAYFFRHIKNKNYTNTFLEKEKNTSARFFEAIQEKGCRLKKS
jgi:hypothetical protein